MTAAASLDLSIIIVNWNSRAFLEKCLASLFATCGGLAYEILVIDNASYDGSEAMVRERFPSVKFIQGRENLGFARANNQAAQQAVGRNVLFLNPDTEVVGAAIERMVQFIDAHAEAGAVGCKLLNSDGSLQTSCVQAYPTLLNQALDAEWLRRRFPRSLLWGTAVFEQSVGRAKAVEAVSGACLMVRRSNFIHVGRFTEAYFMYAEDMDLCFKLERHGETNYYIDESSVIHHGGQSSSQSSQSQFTNVMLRESIGMFMRLHRGRMHAMAYRALMAACALARLMLVCLMPRSSEATQASARKWISILRWALGSERWVRRQGREA